MATIKAHTDLNQSRTLAEFLPHTTADQTWERIAIAGANLDVPEELQYRHKGDMPFKIYSGVGVPCWSLAALLSVMPIIDDEFEPQLHRSLNKYRCTYEGKKDTCSGLWKIADNPVDACYKMIIKLHELNIL